LTELRPLASKVPGAIRKRAFWVEQMRGQLRPNAFLHIVENKFVRLIGGS